MVVFDSLPEEMILIIASTLSTIEIVSLASSNKQINKWLIHVLQTKKELKERDWIEMFTNGQSDFD